MARSWTTIAFAASFIVVGIGWWVLAVGQGDPHVPSSVFVHGRPLSVEDFGIVAFVRLHVVGAGRVLGPVAALVACVGALYSMAPDRRSHR